MLRHLVFVGASTATLIVPAPAFAATSQYGTAEEARAIRMNFAALGMSAYGHVSDVATHINKGRFHTASGPAVKAQAP
jgi:hypothetical protein